MCDQVIARKFPVVLLIFVLGVTANPQLDIPQFSDTNPQQNPPNDPRTNNQFRGDIRQLLQQLDVQGSEQCTNNVAAQWNYETNINQLTQLGAVRLFTSTNITLKHISA